MPDTSSSDTFFPAVLRGSGGFGGAAVRKGYGYFSVEIHSDLKSDSGMREFADGHGIRADP